MNLKSIIWFGTFHTAFISNTQTANAHCAFGWINYFWPAIRYYLRFWIFIELQELCDLRFVRLAVVFNEILRTQWIGPVKEKCIRDSNLKRLLHTRTNLLWSSIILCIIFFASIKLNPYRFICPTANYIDWAFLWARMRCERCVQY